MALKFVLRCSAIAAPFFPYAESHLLPLSDWPVYMPSCMVLTLCNTSFRKEFVLLYFTFGFRAVFFYDVEDYPVLCLSRKRVKIKPHGAVVQRQARKPLLLASCT